MNRSRSRFSVFAVVMLVCALLAGKADAFTEVLVWEDQLIIASDLAAYDTFGSAVALSGDTLVIGSKGDDDNGKSESGSVYIFNRIGGVWVQGQKLHSPTPVKEGAFGVAVDIDGDTLVVGARAESGGVGNVYVFERTSGLNSWTFVRRFKGIDLAAAAGILATDGKVGATVAVAGDYIAIGSFLSTVWTYRRDPAGDGGWSDSPAAILTGGGGYGAITMAMKGDLLVVGQKRVAAYVYSASMNFLQLKKIRRQDVSGTDDWFSSSVATDGTQVVVADLGADTGAVENHGAGYLFNVADNFATSTKLVPDKVASGDGGNLQIGYSAAVDGDVVVLGSRADKSQGIGSGSAFIFQRNEGGPDNWGQSHRLRASNGGSWDYLGYHTAVEGVTVIAGAPGYPPAIPSLRGYVLSYDVDGSGGPPPPPPPPGGEPAAPSNLVPTVASGSQIDLTWSDNSNNETSFKLQRQPQGGAWTTVTWAAADQTSYSDIGLTDGTWCYRIRSHNAEGFSIYVDATPQCATLDGGGGGNTGIPAEPSNLVPTVVGSSQVDLTWKDNSNNENSFKLQQRKSGGIWTTLTWADANQTSFSVSGLSAASWCYRIRAHSADGFSAYVTSAPRCVTVGGGGGGGIPAEPSNLVPTPLSSTRIDLEWVDNSNNESSFKLQRKRQGGNWWTRTFAAANQTTFADLKVSDGTWCYRIRSQSTDSFSLYVNSTPTCVTIGSGGGGSGSPPAEPTNLTATAASATRIELSWQDNSGNENAFKLQYRPQGTQNWMTVEWVNANQTSYAHNGLAPGGYCYRIRAHNEYGFSTYTTSTPTCVTVGS